MATEDTKIFEQILFELKRANSTLEEMRVFLQKDSIKPNFNQKDKRMLSEDNSTQEV